MRRGGGDREERVMMGKQKNVLSPPSSSSSSQESLFMNCNGKVIFLSFLFTLLSMQRHCAKNPDKIHCFAWSIKLLTDRKTNHKVMQVCLATFLKKFVRRVSRIPASNIFCCLEKKNILSTFWKNYGRWKRRIESPLYDVFLEEGGVGEVLVEDPASGGHLRKPNQG